MSTDEKWYFTEEQLANTPSRKCGIDAVKELKYRQQAANFIQDMGQRLLVAIVYMHRFYVFHSFSQFHKNSIATAALFLAAKVEEQPQTLEHVINIAFICFHKDQQQLPKVRSEQNMEQVDDLLFNENVLLQTLGFDVGIDHPHTHIVSCCHLLKASKDLAQASYFTASNSLHLTTMCLQYKPTLVACFCIHLACKWSNLEIPQSNEGKPWFWYVDPSITARQLEQLTSKFLHTFDRCQSKLNRRVKSESAKQSPSLNHSSLTNSPFDDGPPQVNVPKEGAPPSLTCPFSAEEPIKLPVQTFPFSSTSSRPIADYREAKERERLKREKAACVTNATRTSIESILKSHSHSHQNSQKMSKQTSNNMREQTSNIGDAPRELIKLEAKIEQGIRIEGGIEIEQNGNWENSKTMEMLGRVSKLIHPIRDKPTSTNGRVDAHNATSSVSNDLKPSEIIKPFETEPIMRQPHLSNGFDLMMNREEGIKIETDDSGISSTFMCRNSRDYLSPMKSAQSINALLQKPFDPMPSLLQEIGDCIAQQTSSQVQDTHHHGGRSSQYGDTLDSWKNEDKQKNIAGSYPQSSQLIGSAVKCEKVVLSTVDISPLAVPQQRIPETNPLASAKQMANPSQNPRNIVQTIPRNTENTIIPCLRAPTPTHATGKPVTTTVSMTTTARISKHHKRYKNKKEKKHKHKGKDKPRNKRKHKNEVKEKENHIKMKIPKDKLNLTSKTGTTTTQWQICDPQITSEKKSPQTGLKIKIPKAKLKVTESNSQTLAQAPLKIKIRNDGSSVIGENFKTSASVNTDSTRKRNRGVFVGSGDASSAAPPTKKPHHHPQEATTTTVGQIQGTTTSYPLQQSLQQGQRQNDRHYSSNNKEKYPWSHQESSNKLSQQQFVLLHQ